MLNSRGLRTWCVVAGLLLLVSAVVAATDQPTPVLKAIDRVTRMTHADPGDVTVVSVDAVDWPDATLGGARKGDMAIQVITPGYRVILEVKGQRYEYHTDLDTRVILIDMGHGAETVRTLGGVQGCREDLARRLKIDLEKITVAKSEPTTFPNAALGFPRPDRMYAQVVTPGLHVLLDTPFGQYLYAATDHSVAYGGSVNMWRCSALYIQPVENEPNLNGDLIQVSLAGTNPQVIMQSVTEFYPQANGGILATRRTSRSGFDLLYLAPNAKEPIVVGGGGDVGQATLGPDFSQFAVADKTMFSGGWEVTINKLGASYDDAEKVPFPVDGRPRGLYWSGELPVLGIGQGEKITYYQMTGDRGKRDWQILNDFTPKKSTSYLLNRSESLVVKQTTDSGKPAVKVEVVWFTGASRGIRALIPNFQLLDCQFVPPAGIVFICGKTGDTYKAYCVGLRNREVVEIVTRKNGIIKLLSAPPQSWLQFGGAHIEHVNGNGG